CERIQLSKAQRCFIAAWCIFACVCICLSVSVSVCTCVCICICIFVRVCICRGVFACAVCCCLLYLCCGDLELRLQPRCGFSQLGLQTRLIDDHRSSCCRVRRCSVRYQRRLPDRSRW